MSKDIMKSYNLLNNTAKIIENIDFTSSMTVNFNIAFDVMAKSFAKQTNDDIVNFLYEKYKDTNITRVFLLSKPDFEIFLLEMLPLWCNKVESSEALKCLENFFNNRKKYEPNNTYIFECIKCLTTIKQALLKAQEQERVLEIIKEKNVNIGLVNVLGSVEQYNQTYVYDNMLNIKWCLTEEEFDLLKRYFG